VESVVALGQDFELLSRGELGQTYGAIGADVTGDI